MRISLPLLASSLLLLGACGGAGGSPGGGEDPSPLSVRIGLGDPSVTFDDLTLDFGPAGSPFDGELQLLATASQLYQQTLQDLEDLRLALLYLLTPAFDPLLSTVLALDTTDRIQNPALDHFVLQLWWLAVEGPGGSLVGADGTRLQVDAKSGLGWLTCPLPRTGRVAILDPGVTIDVQRTFLGDGTADFDVAVETTADSPVQGQVLCTVGDNIIEDLGPVLSNTQQRLQRRINRNEFAVKVEVQIVTTGDPLLQDTTAEFDFEVPPLEVQIAEIGKALEGLDSIDQGMWNDTHPGRPMTVGEFAVLVAGGHHLEMGILTPSVYESVDARAQPVNPTDTTYRAATIGVTSAAPGYLRTGPQSVQTVIAALVSVGSWGISIANYDNTAMAFETDDVVETGNMTDLAPFDGVPQSGMAVYVDNSADAVKFITRDAMNRYVLDPAATLTNTAWPGASGRVVSAFRHASGDLLFVTDGEPGEFWVLEPGETVATRIGNAGNAPRTVRAAGDIAAIGAFGSALGFGSLSLYVRSGAGTWGPAPFSKTGSRSVGIDVKELPDGRVAVAYPSFLGNALNLTVVDGTTGEIRKDESLPLPAGCTNPGHCAFVRDDAVDAVLVSCNDSDNIVLLPVSYEETP